MQALNTTGPRCPVRTALDLVGGKWKLLLLYQLADTPLRYSELQKRLPEVSDKVLAQQLRILEQDLLIERYDHRPAITPVVAYRLTPQGRAALPLIEALVQFAQAYAEKQR